MGFCAIDYKSGSKREISWFVASGIDDNTHIHCQGSVWNDGRKICSAPKGIAVPGYVTEVFTLVGNLEPHSYRLDGSMDVRPEHIARGC